MPHGHRYLRMGPRTGHNTDTQTSSGHLNVLADHLSRRDQILKTEWSLNPAVYGVYSEFGAVQHMGSVCTQVQPQTSNLHVSDFRNEVWKVDSLVQSWKGRYVRVPTNGFDQTDSEQVNLAQSGADPHSLPPLAETGMVSGPPTTVHSFPVGPSTNSKVAKAIILSNFFIRGLGFYTSRVEVICRSNQARGFSEQVSNRITVPQRKFTLDLYE